jgi:hypothetical protein
MSTDAISNILNLVVAFLPAGAILGLTGYAWIFGRRKNRKFLKSNTEIVSQTLQKVVPQGFDVEQATPSGTSLVPRKDSKEREGAFRRFRVVFSLEDRHLLLTWIMSLFSGSKDVVAFEFDPKYRSPVNLEIISAKEKRLIQKEKDKLLALDTVELASEVRTTKAESKQLLEEFDSFFEIKASNSKLAMLILARTDLLQQIVNRHKELIRISIDRKRDHSIRILTAFKPGAKKEQREEFFRGLSEFAFSFVERINDVAQRVDKGGYKGIRQT